LFGIAKIIILIAFVFLLFCITKQSNPLTLNFTIMLHEAIIDTDVDKIKSDLLKVTEDKTVDLSHVDKWAKLSPKIPVNFLDGPGPYQGHSPTSGNLGGTLGIIFYSDGGGGSYCGTTACFVSSQHFNLNGFTLNCPGTGWSCCTFTRK